MLSKSLSIGAGSMLALALGGALQAADAPAPEQPAKPKFSLGGPAPANPPADSNPSKPDATVRKPGPGLFDDQVVARARTFTIMRSQLEEAFIEATVRAAERGQTIPDAQRPQIERKLLDDLIFSKMLLARSTEADRAKGKLDAEKEWDVIQKQAPSPEALQRKIQAMGLKETQFRAKLEEQGVLNAIFEREYQSRFIPTAEQVKKFYDDNPDKFKLEEQVRAGHILLSTSDPTTGQGYSAEVLTRKRALMENLLARARKGEDFGKLAAQYSEDPGSKNNGGEYTFGRGRMVPEFESAAFSMATNQVSEVITTQFGYHIIKLHEKIPARKVPLDEATAKIREYLIQQETARQLPDIYEKLKKDHGVEVSLR